MHRRVSVGLVVAAVGLGSAVFTISIPGTASARQTPAVAAPSGHEALVRYQREHGYLPGPERPAGLRRKAATVDAPTLAPIATGRAPVGGPAWVGITDTRNAPADPVDAIGPNSFELANGTKTAANGLHSQL